MRALSSSSPSWFGLVLASTAIAAMGCGSDVTMDDPKGTVITGTDSSTNLTSSTGTGGAGGTSTVTGTTGTGGTTTSSPTTSTSVSTSTSTATTSWPTACDEVCAKVADECNQGDLCGSYGLDCGNPQYECPSSCVAGADCSEVEALLEAVATQSWQALQKLSPATQSCLMDCFSTGTGSTGTGSTGTNIACGQCAQQNCPLQGCGQTPQCQPWRQCTMNCANKSPQCFSDCNKQFPQAAPKYEPFYECMCQSCDSQCGASMDPCNQGAPGSGGAGGAPGSGGTGGTGAGGSGTGAAGGLGGAASSTP